MVVKYLLGMANAAAIFLFILPLILLRDALPWAALTGYVMLFLASLGLWGYMAAPESVKRLSFWNHAARTHLIFVAVAVALYLVSDVRFGRIATQPREFDPLRLFGQGVVLLYHAVWFVRAGRLARDIEALSHPTAPEPVPSPL